MRYTDIAIIGGGLAGSTAAAMLGRAGIPAILVDPRPVYPPDFRVEKLSGREQLARFRRTGIAEVVHAGRLDDPVQPERRPAPAQPGRPGCHHPRHLPLFPIRTERLIVDS